MKITSEKSVMAEYLRDESKKTGSSERLFFPETEEDILSVFRSNPALPVTIQGARTGVTGGCVPEGGLTINMERMNQVLDLTYTKDGGTITAQPGILLQTLRNYIRPHSLFFPPDPTESTASLGGMVSCNSSGARSYHYGSIRDYVLALDIVLQDGDKLHLERGDNLARENKFHLVTDAGRWISGVLPDLQMPSVKKHTAGYYLRPDMDLIDLFIGAEGTLGAVTSVKLKLLPQKKHTWGGVVFLPSESSALKLVKILRGEIDYAPSLPPEALEFFDFDTLSLLRQAQISKTALTEMERIRQDAYCAVYVEYSAESREPLSQVFDAICDILEPLGGDPFRTWAAINPYHMEKLHLFRHAAPECINMKISEIKKAHPSITKLSTDMSVPDCHLDDIFALYRSDLKKERLNSVIFGHVGNNHVHVNVIPENMDEFYRCKAMFAAWAKSIVTMGGTVSSEHGIGKLKTALLQELYTKEQLAAMLEVKKLLDPTLRLNRGNIFQMPVTK